MQVIGREKQKKKIAVTYKWSWASVPKNRDQVPSELPRLLGSSRVSAARKSSLLTVFFAGLLALQSYSFLQTLFLICHHQKPANKPTVKHLLKKLKKLIRRLHFRHMSFQFIYFTVEECWSKVRSHLHLE